MALLAERTRRAIYEAIVSKTFDGRLPSEDELAKLFDVSRFTVRTALHHLEMDGIVLRRRGIGTVVNRHLDPAVLSLMRMEGWEDAIRAQGFNVLVETTWRRVDGASVAADAWEWEAGERAIEITRLYFADDEIAVRVVDIAPLRVLKDEGFQGVVPLSLTEFAREYWVESIESSGVEVVPRALPEVGENELDLPPGSAFLGLDERHYSGCGNLLAISDVAVNSDLLPVVVVRK